MIWLVLLFLTITNSIYGFLCINRIKLLNKLKYLGVFLFIPPIGIIFTFIMLLYAIIMDAKKQIKLLKEKW